MQTNLKAEAIVETYQKELDQLRTATALSERRAIKAEAALREIVRHADRMNDPNRSGTDPDVIDMGNIARAALEGK